MNNYPLISVVVPVYNCEKYIKTTLECLIKQTYKNLEIVVVDDGSKDKSAEIIKEYAKKDGRIKPVFKENGGVTAARFAGVEKCTGEYIGFVDGDDELEYDMYELLYENAEKYGADISHCGFKRCFEDGRETLFYNSGKIIVQDNKKGLCDLLEGILIEPGLWNKLFSAKLVKEFVRENKMDMSIKINEDLLMNYYLFSKSEKSVFEDKCKYRYIARRDSASMGKMNEYRMFDPIKVKRIILGQCSDDIKTNAQKAYMATVVYCYCTVCIDGKKKNAKGLKKIREYILDDYAFCDLLDKRPAILCKMIAKVPFVFGIVYPIYVKLFQKSKYN